MTRLHYIITATCPEKINKSLDTMAETGGIAQLTSTPGQKNRYTQSTQSYLDAIFFGQIGLEFNKTK